MHVGLGPRISYTMSVQNPLNQVERLHPEYVTVVAISGLDSIVNVVLAHTD